MDKKSKILIWCTIIILLLSIATTFYRSYILHDYVTTVEVECDPATEIDCFQYEDDKTEIYYYKIMSANAVDIINLCGKDIRECALTCDQISEQCTYTLCRDINAERYGECAVMSTEKNIQEIDNLPPEDIEMSLETKVEVDENEE